MNPSSGTGQPSAQTPAQQLYPNMIRPNQIAQLPCLTPDRKVKSESALTQIWSIIESRPVDSPEHKQALAKLQSISQGLKNALTTWKQQQQQNRAGASQNQGQQRPVSTPTTQQGAQAQLTAQNQNIQKPGQQNPQVRANVAPGNQQVVSNNISREIINRVNTFRYAYPPTHPAGTPHGNEWLEKTKQAYATWLQKMEESQKRRNMAIAKIEQLREAGQDIPQELLNHKTQAETVLSQAMKTLDSFHQSQTSLRASAGEQMKGQVQSNAPRPKQEAGLLQASGSADSKSGGDMSHPPPGFNTTTGGPSIPAIDTARAAAALNRPSNSPVSASQPQPQHSGIQVSSQAGQASHHLSSNSNQSRQPQNAQQGGQMPMPSSQISTSVSSGPPSLSHQAAITAAQQSYNDPQRSGQPAPGQNYSASNRENIANPRMPIPKHAPTPASPTPVAMGQARPTMGGSSNGVAGVMNQPALAKPPGTLVNLEGDGGSVLGKKKLDELVRQVTGSIGGLTPDVEELIMETADEFVDNVISSACRLAKLRPDQTLDIRDVQLVLERNYNIRIPGYALDEVRTVRKVNPAPGWSQKMNAINAAKVMGGKTDS